jgi:cytochrome c oxidase subunit 4
MSAHGPADAAHAAPDDHSSHAHGGLAKYYAVFFALCFLTMLSFWTFADFPFKWPYHDQPMVGRVFMMAVSCTKALLVILFFMHVKYEANWKYVLTIPAGLMSIFLILMLIPDVGNRNKKEGWGMPTEERINRMAEPREATDAHAAAEHH